MLPSRRMGRGPGPMPRRRRPAPRWRWPPGRRASPPTSGSGRPATSAPLRRRRSEWRQRRLFRESSCWHGLACQDAGHQCGENLHGGLDGRRNRGRAFQAGRLRAQQPGPGRAAGFNVFCQHPQRNVVRVEICGKRAAISCEFRNTTEPGAAPTSAASKKTR